MTYTHTYTPTHTHTYHCVIDTLVIVTDTHKHIDRVLCTYMTSYLPQTYRLSILIDKQALFINSWLIRLSVDNVLLINTWNQKTINADTITLNVTNQNIDQQSPPVIVSFMVRWIFDDLVPRVDEMMVKSTSELLGVKFGRDMLMFSLSVGMCSFTVENIRMCEGYQFLLISQSHQ